MCVHWSFFIMGPFLRNQSTACETQIMACRMGSSLMSQKDFWVLRPGERVPMLGMAGGDSGVFEKGHLLAQVNRPRMPREAGGLLDKGVSGTLGLVLLFECVILL